MRHYFPIAVLIAAIAAAPATAATPLELARRHIGAVAVGDVTRITADYTDQSWLSWVGGPLDGTYFGLKQIGAAWAKFSKLAPLRATVRTIHVYGNPMGSTVVADVLFRGKTTIKVRYVMLYRGQHLIDEIWQIDPNISDRPR